MEPGDHVKIRSSAIIGSYPQLRGKVGVVKNKVDDGTSAERVTVTFDDGTMLEGCTVGSFEIVEGSDKNSVPE